MLNDFVKAKGIIKAVSFNVETGIRTEKTYRNLIMDYWFKKLVEYLSGKSVVVPLPLFIQFSKITTTAPMITALNTGNAAVLGDVVTADDYEAKVRALSVDQVLRSTTTIPARIGCETNTNTNIKCIGLYFNRDDPALLAASLVDDLKDNTIELTYQWDLEFAYDAP